ncbi:MAG: hypothetical protein WCT52_02815 [Candidatus Micrarchaeia archaeon]|jgi:hypothetical protein
MLIQPQHKPKINLIAPHQNEHPTAVPFLKAFRKHLQEQGHETASWKISNTHKLGWTLRQRISEFPPFFKYDADEITRLSDFATFALAVQDVLKRARHADSCLQSNPGSMVIEVHSWLPDNKAGSGGPYEKDLKNGFILDNFRHVLNFPQTVWRDETLLGCLARLMSFDINDAREQIRAISKRFREQNAKIFCLEVPAQRTVRLIKNSNPLYPLYYKPDGTIYYGISEFEQLYSIKAFCGAAYENGEVARIASSIMDIVK